MLEKIQKSIGLAIEACVIAGSAVIVVMVVTEVVLRKGFGSSLIVTEELARYLLVWTVFLASAIAIRDNSHIRINALVKHLSPRHQIALALLAQVMSLIFLVLLMIESCRILPSQFQQTCICFDVPIVCFYLAIPVGCLLMILYIFPKIRDIWQGKAVESANFIEEPKDKALC